MKPSRKIFLGMFLFSVFLIPAFTQAMTVADIQAKIQSLILQIRALQEQLDATTSCKDFNQNIKFGDGGPGAENMEPEVKNLHQFLEGENYFINPIEKSGISVFGESTLSAIIAFQNKYRGDILNPNGLSYGTGYVGPSTRAKINQFYDCEEYVPSPGNSKITVTSPNGGGRWLADSIKTITWRYGDGINIGKSVDLYLYEGKPCYDLICPTIVIPTYVLAERISAHLPYKWIVATDIEGQSIPTGDNYYIGVCDAGSRTECDSSDKSFTITSYDKPDSFSVSPSVGTAQLSVEFTSKNLDDAYLYRLDYGDDDTMSINNKNCYEYKINCGDPVSYRHTYKFPGTYRARLQKVICPTYDGFYPNSCNFQDADYETIASATIVVNDNQSSLSVLSPNGGESLTYGHPFKIRWNYSKLPQSSFGIKLQYSSGVDTLGQIIYCDLSPYVQEDFPDHNNFWYEWRVGYDSSGNNMNIPNGQYRVMVYDCNNVTDISDQPFNITG